MLSTSYVRMVSASALCLAFRLVTDSPFCYFSVTLSHFSQLVYLRSVHINVILDCSFLSSPFHHTIVVSFSDSLLSSPLHVSFSDSSVGWRSSRTVLPCRSSPVFHIPGSLSRRL